jgi:coproporphyrinogen III oxidase
MNAVNEKEVVRFLYDTERTFDAYCERFNSGVNIEKRDWQNPLGDIRVAISRGDVFEKASAVFCDIEVDTPPVLKETMKTKHDKMRALVLEIGLHPMNPHIPKSYIELRANIADEVVIAGGTDIFPYYENPSEVALFARSMRQICESHGQDYETLKGVRADFFQSKYTGEPVGSHAGVYFFKLDVGQLPYFKAMTAGFFDTYAEIVEKLKDRPFTADDKRRQETIHGQWAQWVMVEDEGTRFGLEMGIPAEALLGGILPPVARY